jgi:hypothetical protein
VAGRSSIRRTTRRYAASTSSPDQRASTSIQTTWRLVFPADGSRSTG